MARQAIVAGASDRLGRRRRMDVKRHVEALEPREQGLEIGLYRNNSPFVPLIMPPTKPNCVTHRSSSSTAASGCAAGRCANAA